jgi:hypothetical protein
MYLCSPAILVLVISILNIIGSILIFNFNLLTFITDILISIFLVFLVNFFCSKEWMTVSWIISIFLTLISFFALYLARSKAGKAS